MTKYIFLSLLVLLCACSTKEDKSVESVKTDKVNTEVEKLHVVDEVKVVKKLPRTKQANTEAVKKFCRKIDKKFLHWGWGLSRCESYKWNHVRNSVKGDPLMWVVYGDEKEHKKEPKEMTMVMCGVHGDEITPIKFCFDVMTHLERIKHGIEPGADELKDKLIVVAPIVSPDSFFKRRPTRTNARGVDLNRNFPTKDWNSKALKLWKNRYKSAKRRYPGKKPLSEPETLYQVNLIKRYKPQKIISVHAPLTIIDYDGPGKGHDHVSHKANELLIQMSKEAKGYKIKNYPFFPGSLGNYAGNERGIPTYTLELPSSDNRNHKKYWSKFKSAMHYALLHELKADKDINVAMEDAENTEKNSKKAN